MISTKWHSAGLGCGDTYPESSSAVDGRAYLPEKLERNGALTGDDGHSIVGRHERGPGTLLLLCACCLPGIHCWGALNHMRSIAPAGHQCRLT